MPAVTAETKANVAEALKLSVAMLNATPDFAVDMNKHASCAYAHASPYATVVSLFGSHTDALRDDTFYLFASGEHNLYPDPLGAAGKAEFARRAALFLEKLEALEITQ